MIYQEYHYSPEKKNPKKSLPMNANLKPDMNLVFENIISSFEDRIQKIQTAYQSSENIAESSHSLFDSVHNSLNNLKRERDVLNSRLCETLAKNGSLRKKDYNSMMASILGTVDEKEKEAESQFMIFIEAQKETIISLKTNLLGIKDVTSPDASGRIALIKEQLSQILKLQELRKETAMKSFLSFQQLHNRLMECLENILKKGDHILVKDIKDIKNQLIKEII